MGQQAECIAHKGGLATVRRGEKCGRIFRCFFFLRCPHPSDRVFNANKLLIVIIVIMPLFAHRVGKTGYQPGLCQIVEFNLSPDGKGLRQQITGKVIVKTGECAVW